MKTCEGQGGGGLKEEVTNVCIHTPEIGVIGVKTKTVHGPSVIAMEGGAGGGGRGAYSFVACLSHLTTDHAFLSRRSAPFLLLLETTPTFRRPLRIFHSYTIYIM